MDGAGHAGEQVDSHSEPFKRLGPGGCGGLASHFPSERTTSSDPTVPTAPFKGHLIQRTLNKNISEQNKHIMNPPPQIEKRTHLETTPKNENPEERIRLKTIANKQETDVESSQRGNPEEHKSYGDKKKQERAQS